MNNEEEIVVFLLDISIREQSKPYIEDWMFTRDAYKAIAMTILKDDFDGLLPDFHLLELSINSSYKNLKQTDLDAINKLLASYRPPHDRDKPIIIKIMSEFIKGNLLHRGTQFLSEHDYDKADYYLTRGNNFTITEDDFIDPSNFEVMKALISKDMPRNGTVMKSSLTLVNRNSIYGGYKSGDLIMVCAAPKAGKSTFMCQEGASIADQGFKVSHLWIGDMSSTNGFCKYCSNITQIPLKKIIEDVMMGEKINDRMLQYYQDMVNEQMVNIRYNHYPAMSRTLNEILCSQKNLKNTFDYDMLIIDYDANIIPPADNMYESGGIMYAQLKGYGEATNCATMIGAQPKQCYWGDEILNGNSPSESSRKSHAVDFLITFGKNPKSKIIGKAHVPYIRNGESEVKTCIFFDYSICTLREISSNDYDQLLAESQNSVIDPQGFSKDPLEQ